MVRLPRRDRPVTPIVNIVFIIDAFAVIAWVQAGTVHPILGKNDYR